MFNRKLALALVVILSLVFSGVAMAQTYEFEFPRTTTVGVLPAYVDPWTSGDAGQECVVNLDYDFGLKVEWDNEGYVPAESSGACDGQGSCTLADEFNNAITISNNDGTFFDWTSSPFALGAVVVKGGRNANVFYYDPAVFADSGLYSPINNNQPFEVSHASFCWNMPDDQCYQDETAWAVGDRYVNKGNWAMYVEYEDEEITVPLRADGGDGVGMNAGTATFSEPVDGYVTITINLENTFIFYYDLNDDEDDNNLKVQDYDKAPKRTPNPGGFDWKAFIPTGSTTGSITVPVNNFYGVHLDLAYQVACE